MQHQRRDFKNQRPRPERPDWAAKFNPDWITQEIDKNTVEFSKDFGKYLARNGLTTSQIRNVYGELKRIQMKGFDSEKSSFLLLLPKMAYTLKRNESRGNKDGLEALRDVFEKIHASVKDEKNYQNMMDLMEAILAYHKAFGGKEN